MKVRANVNFALIKYWGKKEESLKIPFQSSLSFTVDNLYTETKVSFDKSLREDVITINGLKTGQSVLRVKEYLNQLRKFYHVEDYCYLDSENFVPTASGLASSASAFASIAFGFLNHLNLSDEELSKAARLGSGSASRSIYGGFSVWHHGNNHDTSFATPLDIEWDDFRIIVCLLDSSEKKHSSSEAMQIATRDSSYQDFVKKSKMDLTEMLEALKQKNLDLVGLIAERNSEMMHNLIERTGIIYKTKTSKQVIAIINKLRGNGIKAYFTMDAGPNVKIITTEQYVSKIIQEIPFETIICKSGNRPLIIK